MRFSTFAPIIPVLLVMSAGMSTSYANPTVAVSYFTALQAHAKFVMGEGRLDQVEENPAAFAGRYLDLSGLITGVVSTENSRTALVKVGTASVPIQFPPDKSKTSWADSDLEIRLLVAVQKPDANGAWLKLISAAPASEVADIEQAEISRHSRTSNTSRSMGYTARYEPYTSEAMAVPGTRGGPIAPLPDSALRIYPAYRAAIHGMNPRLSDADLDKITTSILYFSDQNKIDPRLVVAMIIAESGFNLRSTSHTGAMGLGQLMPSTARGLGVTNAYDPVQNIGAAVHILRGRLDSYGGAPAEGDVIPYDQIALMMAAYNAGPGAVRKFHGVPPYRETQRYVKRVSDLYRQMCRS